MCPVMNEENGKHEFNFFLDKQIQQKLLEANEELLEKEFMGSLLPNNGGLQTQQPTNKNNGNSGAQQSNKLPKYSDCVHVCGWCPNPNTVYRKSESDAPPRSRGHHLAVTRDSLLSRDSKSRPQNIDNFVFRHYSDPRKYIEQYRKEHSCYDSTNSSATKNEFLETRRFYAYNQYSALAVGSNSNASLHQQNSYVPQPQLEPPPIQNNETISKSHQQQTPSLQYTNRREQKRNTISANLNPKNQHQYKLTKTPPNANKAERVTDYTEEYVESLEILKKQRRSGSAKERSSATANGLGIQKSATKINVPTANFGGKTLRTANTGVSSETTLPSHLPGQKLNQNTTGRMLDTLACVAGNGGGGDKQPQLPSLTNQGSSSNPGTPSSKKRPTTTTSTIATENTTTATATSSTTTTVPRITTPSSTPATAPTPRVAFFNDTNNDDRDNNRLQSRSGKNNNLIKSSNKTNNEKDDSSSATSEVSISQLSTTCLGADATVKSRPKLEASKTYHVFHNEFSAPSTSTSSNGPNQFHQHQQHNQMLSVVWNPGKSAVVEKRPRPSNQLNSLTADMMGMGGPFRNSPRRPATEEGGYRSVEFVTKEFIQDAKPLNLRTADVFKDVARMGGTSANVSAGLKTNTIKPDLPSSFSLQGVSKRPQFETLKKKRRASKTAVVRRKKDQPSVDQEGGRKSWSASTDASNTSASGGASTLRLKPVPSDASGNSNGGGGGSTTLPAPYFKFWNSSLPPKSHEGRRRGFGGNGVDKMAGDIDMQELAEMVLANESGNDNADLTDAAKRVLEFKSDTEQGIATGDSGLASSVHGATKEELLASLRGVNKRPPKPATRPLHLTYLTGEVITTPTTNTTTTTALATGRKQNSHDDKESGSRKHSQDENGSGSRKHSQDDNRDGSRKHSRDDNRDGSRKNSRDDNPDGSRKNSRDDNRDGSRKHSRDDNRDGSRKNSRDDNRDGSRKNSRDDNRDGSRKHSHDNGSINASSGNGTSDYFVGSNNKHGYPNHNPPLQNPKQLQHQQFQHFGHRKSRPRLAQKQIDGLNHDIDIPSLSIITGGENDENRSNCEKTSSRNIQENPQVICLNIDVEHSDATCCETDIVSEYGLKVSKSHDDLEQGEAVNNDRDDNDTLSITLTPKRPNKPAHHQNQHSPRREVIFLSEKEGAELLSSAKIVKLNEESDFMSTLSDWKQICAEYKSYKDTSYLIREAKNKELKHLIARRFDKQSSLSHQRRIKHLIEQSRLKSYLANASGFHFKSDVGGDNPVVHRFIDIKSGIKPSSSSGDLRGIGCGGTRGSFPVVSSYDKIVKPKTSKLKRISVAASGGDLDYNNCHRDEDYYLSPSPEQCSIEASPRSPYAREKERENSPCCGIEGFDFNNGAVRKGDDKHSSNTKSKIVHVVVPCGIDPENQYVGSCDEGYVNKGEENIENTYSCADIISANAANTRGSSKIAQRKSSHKTNSSAILHPKCVNRDSQHQNIPDHFNTSLQNRTYDDSGDEHPEQVFTRERGIYHDGFHGKHSQSRVKTVTENASTVYSNGAIMNSKNKNNAGGEYVEIGREQINEKNTDYSCRQQGIPLICGTAIRDRNTSGIIKVKGKNSTYTNNANDNNNNCNLSPASSNSKPSRLSPLLESNIELLAAKMAVKINTTRLKYTKSSEVERSHSMHF